ncbi:MAG: hypothetical protein H0W68_04105 [Gemmatimonadaceae bacterium]|nr:hypothetical protein [Gemmatimonadaceae bacterium]
MDLPPAVVAAEAELMDEWNAPEPAVSQWTSDSPATADPGFIEEVDASPVASAAPFVTETMAELYVQQGLTEQALAVYRQLVVASPNDARLRDRLVALERGAEPARRAAVAGPSVRDFFTRLAARRPGVAAVAETLPSPDDFGGEADAQQEWSPPIAASAVETAPAGVMATPAAEGPAAEVPAAVTFEQPSAAVTTESTSSAPATGGSLDALFGNRASTTSEDSAASALAQAFGGASETPQITGRPARAAAGELSLDSVFRDGNSRAPRVSQSFSFDQFFTEGAVDAANPTAARAPAEPAPTGEPAERSADDIEQFNSWLQGLKQR